MNATFYGLQWCSSHYTVTHVRNKNSNISREATLEFGKSESKRKELVPSGS